MKYSTKISIIFLLLSGLFSGCKHNPDWIKNHGEIFGTTYHLTYESPGGKDYHTEILIALDSVNQSLSTYDSTSVITRFNRSVRGTSTDNHFRKVFRTAKKITEDTNGAFDMTVAPLVNAWGFGFSNKMEMTSTVSDSLQALIGMHHVRLKNDSVIKYKKNVMIDASAIAKGYGVDIAAATLNRLGCENYMVEIGGEVATSGQNPRDQNWRIGIDRPIDDPTASKRQLQLIVELSGLSLATSGNYRQFYIDEHTGKKYAHTINPATGKPVEHSLLSASIVAMDCMTADAYATACMVMGLEKSMDLMKQHPEMEGCFIYDSEEGMQVAFTKGFKKYVAN